MRMDRINVTGRRWRPADWRRRVIAIVSLLALAVSGCSSAPSSGHPRPAASASIESPGQRCGGPQASGRIVTLAASDGVRLDAAEVGSGAAGVVLVHEYPADLCGFWPYAVYLSQRGLHVLDLDLRCFGSSACPPTDAARADLAADVSGAVAELHRRGARRVAVLGASMGGTVALAAAAEPQSAVSAVVCLSCHASFTPHVGGTAVPLTVGAAVRVIRCPALYVVASDDPHLKRGEVQALYRDTGSADKHLDVLTGPQATTHGWDLLGTTDSGWTAVAGTVAAFLVRTTAAT
ncbi:alpha/beta hydrolase [Plantactinospora siamensis]|uniref:Alpha/beta hydrolase n=1 Tax=Plantactinospora siamensis TaxID=555372 RepID=A0ABV6P2M1_9ACTN